LSYSNEVRAALQKINDAWLKGPPDDLAQSLNECFDEDMVVRGPGFQELARGRAACVQSYEQFLREAKVRQCRLDEPSIDVFGDTALAVYGWDMIYELNGQEYHETGCDLFLFKRASSGWLAVWRAMTVNASS